MTYDPIIRFKDGSVRRCDVSRESCQEPATHHTNDGAHYCDKHWAQKHPFRKSAKEPA